MLPINPQLLGLMVRGAMIGAAMLRVGASHQKVGDQMMMAMESEDPEAALADLEKRYDVEYAVQAAIADGEEIPTLTDLEP